MGGGRAGGSEGGRREAWIEIAIAFVRYLFDETVPEAVRVPCSGTLDGFLNWSKKKKKDKTTKINDNRQIKSDDDTDGRYCPSCLPCKVTH